MLFISPMTWCTTVPSAFALGAVVVGAQLLGSCGLLAAAVLPRGVLACSWLYSFTSRRSALFCSFAVTVNHPSDRCPLRALSHVLCVVGWTDHSSTPSFGSSGVRLRSCFACSASASAARSRRSSLFATLHSCRRCVWLCASWSAGTSRRRHECIKRPVIMSGGDGRALLLFPVLVRSTRRFRCYPHREALSKVLCSRGARSESLSVVCLYCFVLFCFVLFCFVLFCFVLFCFVLFCFVLFVVGWLIFLKEQSLSERLTLAKLFSLIFVGKMCVFVSRPMKIATFLLKNGDFPKLVVYFLLD